MKPALIFILFMFATSLSSSALAGQSMRAQDVEGEDKGEHSVVTQPGVIVSLCLESGSIVVRGWGKREVRAHSAQGEKIGLRANTVQEGAGIVNVLVGEEARTPAEPGWCDGTGRIELDVPRDATVNLQLRDGDIEVTDVREARVESLQGDVNLERIAKTVEVSCLSGDISLADSAGRVRLHAVSGEIEAANVRPLQAGDTFNASTTSGDVTLEGIAHAQVKATTINGSVRLSGALTRGGNYEFQTTTGDVTLTLPPDASFRVNARAVASGDIITDFPLKPIASTAVTKEPLQNRHVGIVGSGDASLNLTTFSGTVHLKRQ